MYAWRCVLQQPLLGSLGTGLIPLDMTLCIGAPREVRSCAGYVSQLLA